MSVAQFPSYRFFLEASKRNNPKPGLFPDYIIQNNMLFGWFGLIKATRSNSWLPGFYCGTWKYEMTPLRGAR